MDGPLQGVVGSVSRAWLLSTLGENLRITRDVWPMDPVQESSPILFSLACQLLQSHQDKGLKRWYFGSGISRPLECTKVSRMQTSGVRNISRLKFTVLFPTAGQHLKKEHDCLHSHLYFLSFLAEFY